MTGDQTTDVISDQTIVPQEPILQQTTHRPAIDPTHNDTNNNKPNEIDDTTCKICEKQFPSIRARKTHYATCKLQLKCSTCNHLSATFKSHSFHVKVCMGISSFKCYICNKTFTDIHKCSQHIYNCQSKLNCTKCTQKFPTLQDLMKHCDKNHPILQCNICQKKFLVKLHLDTHLKTHQTANK